MTTTSDDSQDGDENAVVRKIRESLEFIHQNLDGFKIKEKVDEMGIHKYINYCAGLAAGTGALAGAGGGLTMIVGLPADMINTVAQQFRVTLAVIYHKTGRYSVSFPEFMRIVGLSLGVEVGFKGLEFITNRVAQEIVKRLVSRGMGKFIPVLGGLLGGGLNFGFIKGVGTSLLALGDEIFE